MLVLASAPPSVPPLAQPGIDAGRRPARGGRSAAQPDQAGRPASTSTLRHRRARTPARWRSGRKGTVFVGTRNKPAGDIVYARRRQERRPEGRSGPDHRERPERAERRRLSRRRPLRRRDRPHRPLRRHRVEARVAGAAGRRQRHAAEGHAPRPEVHRLRARRPALRAGRRALQRLRQGEGRSALRQQSCG